MSTQLLSILAGMIAALFMALLVLMIGINPPAADLQQLVLFMGGTGGITVLASYLFFRLGLDRWFPSLRWSLLSVVFITVLLVLLNVWVTAQLMFFSEHDLALATALLLFAGLTALTFGIFVSSTITQRIQDLSQAAGNIARGKLKTRLTVHGSDELSELSRTFNSMANSLEQLDEEKRMVEQARRDLIAWVSHDLRTPLTSMRAMLEAVSDEIVDDPETISRYVDRSLSEVGNLSRLIDDLFELTKLDTGRMELQLFSTSMRDLISDVLSNLKAQANTRQITLMGEIEEQIDPVHMAPDKIQRVLYNLTDNALRYTPQNGIITIKACLVEDNVQVDVCNTGASIPKEHLPHIFTSFYRIEQSRSHNQDGYRSTGLGLAIARGLVEAHRGKIWVKSDQEIGTTFSFLIPRTSTS